MNQPPFAFPGFTAAVEVVAAVIMRSDGEFLLTRRPEGKIYAGHWEFPGGKVEQDEPLRHALIRELWEELGIQVRVAHPWLTRVFCYSHAKVRLHFFRVLEWEGEPIARENQGLSWQFPHQVEVSPILPANAPILQGLSLPSVYAITQAADVGSDVALKRIEYGLEKGMLLWQIREKQMTPEMLKNFSQQVIKRVHACGGKVIINGNTQLARHIGADGVHLTAAQLMTLSARPDPTYGICGASCHNAEELFVAEQLGLDYVVLSPVNPTLSHPEISPLGWRKFARLIQDYSMPVYALGGLGREDVPIAQEMGAHGIAMMRGAATESSKTAPGQNSLEQGVSHRP